MLSKLYHSLTIAGLLEWHLNLENREMDRLMVINHRDSWLRAQKRCLKRPQQAMR